MKNIISISIFVLLFSAVIFPQKEGNKTNIKEAEKHFKREDVFPKGEQTSVLIGSFLSGIKDVNVVTFTFDAPYEKVWRTVKRVAKKFDKEGGRPIVATDESTGRVQNGQINQNNLIGMGASAWFDEVVVEATQVDNKTKVSVTRKVVEREMKRDLSKEWRSQFSNGKVERWLLTQIEDELNTPSEKEVRTEATPILNETAFPQKGDLGSDKNEFLTNKEILGMVEAKLPDSIIIAKIKKSKCKFDISADALIGLKKAGVNDAIIQEMIAANGNE